MIDPLPPSLTDFAAPFVVAATDVAPAEVTWAAARMPASVEPPTVDSVRPPAPATPIDTDTPRTKICRRRRRCGWR